MSGWYEDGLAEEDAARRKARANEKALERELAAAEPSPEPAQVCNVCGHDSHLPKICRTSIEIDRGCGECLCNGVRCRDGDGDWYSPNPDEPSPEPEAAREMTHEEFEEFTAAKMALASMLGDEPEARNGACRTRQREGATGGQMSTYRQQAIEDVAKVMGRSSGRLSYAVKNGGLGVKAKELSYAVAQRERVLTLEARLNTVTEDYESNMVIKDCKQCHGQVWITDSENGGMKTKCHCYQARCNELREEIKVLKAQIARLTAPVSREEKGFWSSTLGFPEERLNMFIAYRAARAEEGQ